MFLVDRKFCLPELLLFYFGGVLMASTDAANWAFALFLVAGFAMSVATELLRRRLQ